MEVGTEMLTIIQRECNMFQQKRQSKELSLISFFFEETTWWSRRLSNIIPGVVGAEIPSIAQSTLA
jgi:hypothetical protein